MKKRLLALTLVAALFIGLLAGCGNNANKPSDTNTPSDTNQPADTDKTNEPSKDAKGEVYYLNFKPEQNDACRPWPRPTPRRPACPSPWSPPLPAPMRRP